MNKADQDLLNLASYRMSTATIAGMMGWSETRVIARLARLRAEAEPPAPPPPLVVTPAVFAPPPPPPCAPPPDGCTPRRLRFIRWFLAADWPLREVAFLFDVYPEDLSAALGWAG